jgi:hypothetical protein
VLDALASDTELTERQKQVLTDIYESFRRGNAAETSTATGTEDAALAVAAIDAAAQAVEAPAPRTS